MLKSGMFKKKTPDKRDKQTQDTNTKTLIYIHTHTHTQTKDNLKKDAGGNQIIEKNYSNRKIKKRRIKNSYPFYEI